MDRGRGERVVGRVFLSADKNVHSRARSRQALSTHLGPCGQQYCADIDGPLFIMFGPILTLVLRIEEKPIVDSKKNHSSIPPLAHELFYVMMIYFFLQTSKPEILPFQVSKLFKLALRQVRSDFQGGFI